MKRVVLVVVVAVVALAGCGSDDAAISTTDKGGKTVLVDSDGMTLYALSSEKGGKFACTDAKCLAAWKPVDEGGDVEGLGTVKRPDGDEQATYKDEPLYTFSGDKSKDDVKGDGIKDVGVWHAVTVSGGSAPSDSGGGGGGGGGYGGY
jgi:predicted lipoprotein with Yx(FWY)xxD motif